MSGPGLRRAVVLATAAALLWAVSANGIAAGLTRSGNIEAAAAIAPDAERLSRRAERLFFANRFADAATDARLALALSPINTRAARVLGLSELGLRHDATGLAAMEAAAAGGWRDNPTQLWTLQAALAAGATDAAMERADALIRRDTIPDQIFAALRTRLADPGLRASLVARLADEPDWRGLMFLDWRHAQPGDLPGIGHLVADIDRSGRPATELELFPLIERLLELGAVRPARALWQARAPRVGWNAGNLLYDGRFAVARAQRIAGTPPRFQWWIDPEATGLASIGDGQEGGAALRLASTSGSSATLARQTLMLAPARYLLLARLRAAGPRDIGAFTFAVRCYPRGIDLPLPEPRIDQTGPGRLRYATSVTVPADCPRQDLLVRSSGEAVVSTTIDLSEITLRPGI